MFGNEDEFLDWMDDDEITKIKREALKAEEAKAKEYLRLRTLYTYFESMESISKDKIFFFEENHRHLKDMLNAFIEKEEYERCAKIRDWMIRANEIKNGKSSTENNKPKGRRSAQITF